MFITRFLCKLRNSVTIRFGLIDNLNYLMVIISILIQGSYLEPAEVGAFYISTLPSFLLLALTAQSLSLTVLRDKDRVLKFPSIRENALLYVSYLSILVFLLISNSNISGITTNRIIIFCILLHSFYELNSLVCEANQQRRERYLRVPCVRVISSLTSLVCLWCFFEAGLGIISLYYWLAISGFIKYVAYRFINEEVDGKVDLKSLVLHFKNHSTYSFLNFSARNIDQYLFSFILGSAYVGIYSRSLQITQLPLKILNGLISGLFLPLGVVKNAGVNLNAFEKNQNWIVLIACGIAIFYKLVLVELLILIWGEKWAEVSTSINYMAPAIIIQSIIAYKSAHAVIGNQDYILPKVGLINLITILPVPIVAAMFGFKWAVMTYSFSYILLGYPIFEMWVGRHISKYSYSRASYQIAIISIPIAMTLADGIDFPGAIVIAISGWLLVTSVSIFNLLVRRS
jgi:O-antigen/teichoic acid export membrane protein